VQGEFGDGLLILDGGPCSVGIESSIIDCTRGQPVLLRPGAITPEQVQAACGLKVLLNKELLALSEQGPKASGTLESHYAPKARVRLMDEAALRAALATAPPGVALWLRAEVCLPDTGVRQRRMPTDATLAAQQLFATLRELDADGVQHIWIETPPDGPEWDGVRDRLQRAAF
jgi:L-threonylcarbamoyladenylate synthase